MFRTLDESVSVSPQIDSEAVRAAAAAGIKLIINNRPDGEAPDEPQGAQIEAAVRAAGMDYVAIPVGHGGFSAPQVEATMAALASTAGPVLAYCRSGTRSALLWSLARAKMGDPPSELRAKAAAAGYDLGPVDALIEMLAGGG